MGAFRNIPGVELANVNSLNLLQLAPGGHLGRFCVWTQGAFEKLDTVFGTMKNSDLSRLINSDEVQSVLNAPKQGQKPRGLKCNPLKNKSAMERVNPYAAAKKELEAK